VEKSGNSKTEQKPGHLNEGGHDEWGHSDGLRREKIRCSHGHRENASGAYGIGVDIRLHRVHGWPATKFSLFDEYIVPAALAAHKDGKPRQGGASSALLIPLQNLNGQLPLSADS